MELSTLNTPYQVLDRLLALNLSVTLWSARTKLTPEDFGGVALVSWNGVLGELARGVNVVAEHAVIKERDLALDAIVEGDVDDVCLVRGDRGRLDARERAGVRFTMCGHRHNERRGDDRGNGSRSQQSSGREPPPSEREPCSSHADLPFLSSCTPSSCQETTQRMCLASPIKTPGTFEVQNTVRFLKQIFVEGHFDERSAFLIQRPQLFGER